LRTKALILALLAVSIMACAQARPKEPQAGGLLRVVLMPLEDFGEEPGGAFQVQGQLERELPALGYEAADQASLRRLLLRERVRRAGAVGRGLGRAIGEEMGAPLLMIAAVTQYRSGLEPCVGVVARMLEARTGRLVWTGAASATGGQYEKVLGLGRVRDASRLTELVVAELLEGLPQAGALMQSPAKPEEVSP
jgi:hypothetical protein